MRARPPSAPSQPPADGSSADGTAFVSTFQFVDVQQPSADPPSRTIAQYDIEFYDSDREPILSRRVCRELFNSLRQEGKLPEASGFDGGSIVFVKGGIPNVEGDPTLIRFKAAVRIGGRLSEGVVALTPTAVFEFDPKDERARAAWVIVLREMQRAGGLHPRGRSGVFPDTVSGNQKITFKDASGRDREAIVITGINTVPGLVCTADGGVTTGYAADIVSQVVRVETILDTLLELLEEHRARRSERLVEAYARPEFQKVVRRELEGKTFLTEHERGGDKRRTIARIDFARRLRDTFDEDLPGGGTRAVSHEEYFRRKHPDLELEGEDDSPILVYELPPRTPGERPRECFLPPSLARVTGIYDGETELRQKVVALSKMKPEERAVKCVEFSNRIADGGERPLAPDSAVRRAPAEAWGLRPVRSLMQAQHDVLQPPRILSGGNTSNDVDPKTGYFSSAAKNPVYDPVPLLDWLIVHPPPAPADPRRPSSSRGHGHGSEGPELADRLATQLKKAARAAGVDLSEPRVAPANQPSLAALQRSGAVTGAAYLAALRENLRPSTQIVFFILPKNAKDSMYEDIKGGTIPTCGAVTQCVKAESLSNPGKILQVVQGIIRQVVSKCGGEAWRADPTRTIAPRGLGDLCVGLATCRSTRQPGHIVVAAVCVDARTYKQLASDVRSVPADADRDRRSEAAAVGEVVAAVLSDAALKAGAPAASASASVRAFIFRRDVDRRRLRDVELPAVRAAVGRELPGALLGYAVSGKAKQRAYFVPEGASAADPRNIRNPPAGLCVTGAGAPADPDAASSFLVTHSSLPESKGTPILSQYTILQDETGLEKKAWAQLTQNLCCCYPNQPKAINEPGPLRMAQREAEQVASCVASDAPPHPNLLETPFYL
eukprot:tig00020510_g9829.t1